MRGSARVLQARREVRGMCSSDTTEDDIDRFAQAMRREVGAA
jgi:threonine aldolase